MNLNRIFENISNKALIRKYENAQLEMQKYVNISRMWDVSERSAEYVNELMGIKEVVYNFAKKNNVHVDMFIPKDTEMLTVTVSRFNIDGKPSSYNGKRILKLTHEPVTMVKENNVMLEDKDGLNYIGRGLFSTEDTFIRQVYRAVSDLTGKLLIK